MNCVHVNLENNFYDIFIGNGLLNEAGKIIKKVYTGHVMAVITDENVYGLYGERLADLLGKEGFTVRFIVVKPGEGSKSMATLETVYNSLAEMGLKRGELIVAFGGGVVGDLAGYAAATFMRGTPLVAIPTTLLAQVDSSVGGKTAINLSFGKNLVGAFKQPIAVITDCGMLKTLDKREWSGGFSEVIKYAAISSKPFFEQLSLENAEENLTDIIYKCCDMKRALVEADQFDQKERMLLNFGHTFGHAIEKLYDYEKYTHGEAVAAGMVLACKTGEELGITKEGCAEQIIKLLSKYGLVFEPVDLKKLTPMMALDKKRTGDRINLILLKDIGEAIIYPMESENFYALMERGQRKWKT